MTAESSNNLNIIVGVCHEDDPRDVDEAYGPGTYARLFPNTDYEDNCPTCKGRGTVNPLTAPAGYFCTGMTDCPDCDGSGQI